MPLRHAPRAALTLFLFVSTGCAAAARLPRPPPRRRPLPLAGPSHVAATQVSAPAIDAVRRARIEAALPEVGRVFREDAEKNGLPNAALGVVVGDDLAFSAGYGARTDAGGEVSADTVFRIGSITKVFTGMALLALRDEGRIGLDDPVTRYVPELADAVYPTLDSPVITLRNLVTHTSGCPASARSTTPTPTASPSSSWSRRRGKRCSSSRPAPTPAILNLAMALGGLVVSRASGEPARDFITRRILAPLGMRRTYWDEAAVPREKLAEGHAKVLGRYARRARTGASARPKAWAGSTPASPISPASSATR